MNAPADHYENTLEALRKLAASEELREAERRAIAKELSEIEAMVKKLEDGRVEIAVYGEVNAGKSALLNALIGRKVFDVAARAGETRDAARADWTPETREFAGPGAKLVVVDTPGLNEPGGYRRELVARETARYADIVLFVTDGDLNDIEFEAIKILHDLHKPVILVINKADIFSAAQLDQIREAIERRTAGVIGQRDIVVAAGDPAPRTVIVQSQGGAEREETRQRPPQIEALQERIFEILDEEGKAVVAINANLFASEMAERIARLKVDLRAAEAKALIEKFMWGKATVVAFNPVPWLDILGVVASDATMIALLGRIYGQPITTENADRLMREIVGAWGVTGFVTLAMNVLSGAIKTAAPVAGVAVTAIPQGAAAAWATYVVGQAASVYFRDGGWGPKGVKTVLKSIIRNTNPDSVLAPIKERLKQRLKSRA
jgi:hypothetical protein